MTVDEFILEKKSDYMIPNSGFGKILEQIIRETAKATVEAVRIEREKISSMD